MTGSDPDVHLFTDPKQVGDPEINAFQTASTVILQRSTREKFGLVDDAQLAMKIGRAAQASARARFLLPRLVRVGALRTEQVVP
jgi:hypothetical protein